MVVACPRSQYTAFHEELVTRVARLEVHVVVILAHDDEQLAEPMAWEGLVIRDDHKHEQAGCEEEDVVPGNGVVQLVVLLHLHRLLAVGVEEQTAVHKDGDTLQA